jgi:hypothetical protein
VGSEGVFAPLAVDAVWDGSKPESTLVETAAVAGRAVSATQGAPLADKVFGEIPPDESCGACEGNSHGSAPRQVWVGTRGATREFSPQGEVCQLAGRRRVFGAYHPSAEVDEGSMRIVSSNGLLHNE